MQDHQISTIGFRRLVMLLNAGWAPVLPSPTDGIMLTRPAGFGRTKTAFVFDNGTTMFDAPDGGEIRIKSYDEDDAVGQLGQRPATRQSAAPCCWPR
ncbi:hypothetical protein [Stenotrophomonas acidaminiphila]|uniref:hypothetical protein n=1 Tax=Stenotrophomonas acidaminiphila TaxID=128780 RepID=UPI0028B03DDB|nr:hypothetical protein [Stenotrophomonas acidaminiphila]